MNARSLAGLILLAGVVGAAAGGAATLVLGGGAERRGDPAVAGRLDEIARSVESLREASSALRDESAHVRERLAGLEMNLAQRVARTADAAEADETADAGDGSSEGGAVGGRTFRIGRGGLAPGSFRIVRAGGGDANEAQQRFAKGMHIRSLPEDERWALAADKVGLNSVQVDELKRAHAELQEGLKAAMASEERTEDDGSHVVVRRIDGDKMRAAREAFDARVDTLLNEPQKKAWRDEGFETAMARGGGLALAGNVRVHTLATSTGDGASIEFTELQEDQ